MGWLGFLAVAGLFAGVFAAIEGSTTDIRTLERADPLFDSKRSIG
jgi:hypothetical protein